MRHPSPARTARAAALPLFLLLATVAPVAHARTAGDMAVAVFTMFGSFGDLIMGAMFLLGLILGARSLILLKEHSEVPKEWPRGRRPFVYLIASACLIGYPTFMAMTSDTLNGDGSQKNSLSAGVYQRIGD